MVDSRCKGEGQGGGRCPPHKLEGCELWFERLVGLVALTHLVDLTAQAQYPTRGRMIALEILEELQRLDRGCWGVSWGCRGASWGGRGVPWGCRGVPWEGLGVPWGCRSVCWGVTWGRLGCHLGTAGCSLGMYSEKEQEREEEEEGGTCLDVR